MDVARMTDSLSHGRPHHARTSCASMSKRRRSGSVLMSFGSSLCRLTSQSQLLNSLPMWSLRAAAGRCIWALCTENWGSNRDHLSLPSASSESAIAQ